MDTLLQTFLAAALGSLLTLGAQAMQRRWARQDVRNRRAEERSEQAAEALLPLLSEVRARFKNCWEHGSEPDEIDDLLQAMERHTVLLSDPPLRTRLGWARDAIDNIDTVQQGIGDRPYLIAWRACDEASDVLGASLRGEPIPTDSRFIKSYHDAIVEYWEMVEAHKEARGA